VPSRNSTPAVFRPTIGRNPAKFPDPDPKVTRAHVVFLNTLAAAEAADVRDEALLSLLAIRQIAKLAPSTDWSSTMLSGAIEM
jgi:hypothetical protein